MEEIGELSPPTTTAFRLPWDVFLSFRGEDNRYTFTDRLYEAFDSSGVRVFFDDDAMEKGEEIKQSLLDEIEDSAAEIVFISPRYADSHWCLEESARICELRKLVNPAFYLVDLSAVRLQKVPFEADLKRLESKFKVERVARWRNAMARVGGISDRVYSDREEPQLIDSLVRRTRTKLRNYPVAPYIVGLDFPTEELMELLDVTSSGPKIVGLLGTGGIGKTTLSSALYNKLGSHFERRCFLPNVRETYARVDGLLLLQNQLIKDLSMGSVRPVEDENAGLEEIRRKLQGNRVLVVIDDIDDACQLTQLAFHREWLPEGSRIITSTRNRDALPPDIVNKIYNVRKLSHSDSLKLFIYYAFRREKPTEPLLKLSEEIVSITGGLPLALQVFGSFLHGKHSVGEWREALRKLEEIHPQDLQGILRISFDALDMEEKTIFLDIACLLLNLEMNREDVIDVMRGCGFRAEFALTTLISRSLIMVEQDKLQMHDQIRDMGRQIVIQEAHSNIGSRSRIWDPRHVLEVLQDRKGTKNVEGMILDFEVPKRQRITSAPTIAWNQLQTAPNFAAALTYTKGEFKKYFSSNEEEGDEVRIDTKLFESMMNLRLLQFNNVKLEGDFTNIPNAVRWIQWKKCPLKILPHDFYPTELRVLDLSESKIERLWEPKWFWKNQQVAKKLMVLNLYKCYNITSLPDLSEHKCLEKLILELCTSLGSVHKSVGDLHNLRYINLKACPRLVEFLNDVSELKNLEVLLLSGCSQLKNLPHNIGCMTSLRELDVGGTAIEELPETIFRLTKLERLSLDDCRFLKQLPTSIGKLRALRELSLRSSALEELPNSICALRNLQRLDLSWCKSLSVIPESIGDLRSLAYLQLSGSSVKIVPESVGSLYFLRMLSAGNCRSLDNLPVSIEGLPFMVELDLSNTAITSLPDQIGSLKLLKKLELRDCKKLSLLPKSIGNLLALHTLILSKSSITELPESIGKLENLVLLRLNHCEKLSKLPASFGNLKNLRHLHMEHTAITVLPESFGNLSNLMILAMAKKLDGLLPDKTETSTKLPVSFSNLFLLEKFNARAWRISGKIPDDFEKLSSLQHLDLSYNDFCSLPSSLTGLSVLQKLLLSHCKEMKALPILPPSLQELNAANCMLLEKLPDFSNLLNLQEMQFTNCRKLVDIPGIKNLKSLNSLHLGGCSSHASAVIRKLDRVTFRNLRNLSIPGSEIPDWFTRDEICFQKRKNQAITGVIIVAIISLDAQAPENSRLKLPVIADVEAKILRLNKSVFSSALDLRGAPDTEEDQLYLCRFAQFHPLVSILEDGDKIKVVRRDPPFDEGVVLKSCGIRVVYENDDDYEGEGLDENLLSESQRLTYVRITGFTERDDPVRNEHTPTSEMMSGSETAEGTSSQIYDALIPEILPEDSNPLYASGIQIESEITGEGEAPEDMVANASSLLIQEETSLLRRHEKMASQTDNSSSILQNESDLGMAITLSVIGKMSNFVDLKLEILGTFSALEKLNSNNYFGLDPKRDNYLFSAMKKPMKLELYNQGTFKAGQQPSEPPESFQDNDALVPKYLVLNKSGCSSEGMPTADEWCQAGVVNLMEKNSLLLDEKPDCPNLVLLFLQRNNRLSHIPPSFFDCMPALRFLDLSNTRIRALPSSLFKLTKLQVLMLRSCICLGSLPAEVKNLEGMEVLDLLGTDLYNLPQEVGLPTRIKHLQLSFYGPDCGSGYARFPSKLVSPRIFSELRHLQALSIVVHPEDQRWIRDAREIIQHVGWLKMLNYLQFYFPTVEDLECFIKMSPSWKEERLKRFKFVVGHNIKRIISRVPDEVESKYEQQDRCLRFVNGNEVPEVVKTVLKPVTAFYLDHHLEINNLLEFGISNFKELKFCVVRECPKFQVMMKCKSSSDSESAFPNLEHLGMHYLWELEQIWEDPVPPGSFKALKCLVVDTCPKLEFIASRAMLQCLSNLETFIIQDCEELKSIVQESEMVKCDATLLPRLIGLVLRHLPQLVTLGSDLCPPEKIISIHCCPKLILSSQRKRFKWRKFRLCRDTCFLILSHVPFAFILVLIAWFGFTRFYGILLSVLAPHYK